MNEKLDPQFDWPLSNRSLNRYVEKKYSANAGTGQSGLLWAQNNNYAYYMIEKRTTLSTGNYVENKVEISANDYANLTSTLVNTTLADGETIQIDTSKDLKTYYQYEVDLNEEKRTINLLKPEFVVAVEEELARVFIA